MSSALNMLQFKSNLYKNNHPVCNFNWCSFVVKHVSVWLRFSISQISFVCVDLAIGHPMLRLCFAFVNCLQHLTILSEILMMRRQLKFDYNIGLYTRWCICIVYWALKSIIM